MVLKFVSSFLNVADSPEVNDARSALFQLVISMSGLLCMTMLA